MQVDKKQAKADYDRRRRAEKKDEIAATKRAYYLANKAKENARVAAWVAENKDRALEIKKTYRDANKEKAFVYRRSVMPRVLETAAARRLARPWIHLGAQRRRRAGLSRATPAWADMEAIRCIYTEARYLQMEVDHIVPLVGVDEHGVRNVCGLHVENNLQSLTMTANRRKGNYHAG